MKFFQDFKRGLAVAKARQAVKNRIVNMNFTIVDFYGVYVFTDNELLLANCGMYPHELGALMAITNLGPQIYVNEAFNSAPKWAQDAVLMHEFGHYKLEHKPTTKQILGRQFGLLSCLQMEKEADLYSASHGYLMERVLREYLPQNAEVKARIQALEDWEYLSQVLLS